MTRFVELPIVSDRGSTIWVNPDHVVAVEASVGEERSFLLTEMGHRPHIALSQDAAVDALVNQENYHYGEFQRNTVAMRLTPEQAATMDVDLRDSVRENLQR